MYKQKKEIRIMKNWYQTQPTTMKNRAKNDGKVREKEDKKRNIQM